MNFNKIQKTFFYIKNKKLKQRKNASGKNNSIYLSENMIQSCHKDRKGRVIMQNQMVEVLKPLPGKLHNVYGDNLKAVILYGSYARGTADSESDVDVAVILDGTEKEMESYERKLSDVTADFILENDCQWLFSLIPIRFSVFNRWKKTLPFYQNIEKEGIQIYAS